MTVQDLQLKDISAVRVYNYSDKGFLMGPSLNVLK